MEDSVRIVPRSRSARGLEGITRSQSPLRIPAGFTLIELMVTIAVAGVLLAVATPNLRTFMQNNRLSSAANDMLRSFQIARSEAVKRQQNVVVCGSANPTDANPTCSYVAFSGWIVFQDSNFNWSVDPGEPILERHEVLDTSITVKVDKDGIESYGSTGFANKGGARTPTQNILLCDIRGNQVTGVNSVERAVLVADTGRVHVSRVATDVANAAAKTGACP
jgi:type IV fimbrial biogenesis protein FimT